MAYYYSESSITQAQGNNAISFQKRKMLWSDCMIRIPSLKRWARNDVRMASSGVAYEYVDEKWKLISSSGLEDFVEIKAWHKSIYIIDNHNHAFAMWWRSFFTWDIARWSQLIHIDQHSDLAEPLEWFNEELKNYRHLDRSEVKRNGVKRSHEISQLLRRIDRYTNEVLTIADFIKPAHEIGLIRDYVSILTEYSLERFSFANISWWDSYILDIDLDFRAPEMSISDYNTTLSQVRSLIASEQVWCVTIASSPTYIAPELALQVLHDLLD